jgi:hypothetical protein
MLTLLVVWLAGLPLLFAALLTRLLYCRSCPVNQRNALANCWHSCACIVYSQRATGLRCSSMKRELPFRAPL